MEEEKFRNTETTTWIGKHIPLSVSMTSNLIEKPIFLCDPKRRLLESAFIDALEKMATQSEARRKLNFYQSQTAINSSLARIPKTLNERRSHCVGIEADNNNSENRSTQILKMQKNQLIDFQEIIERYCNTLTLFGFNSVRYDISLIRHYLLPVLAN